MVLNLLSKMVLFYVHEYFAYMYVCASHECFVPLEVRRGHWDLDLPTAVENCHVGGYWKANPGPMEGQVLVMSDQLSSS